MTPEFLREAALRLWAEGADTLSIAQALGMREPDVLGLIHAEQDRRFHEEAQS